MYIAIIHVFFFKKKRNLKHEDEAEVVSQQFQKYWDIEMRKKK